MTTHTTTTAGAAGVLFSGLKPVPRVPAAPVVSFELRGPVAITEVELALRTAVSAVQYTPHFTFALTRHWAPADIEHELRRHGRNESEEILECAILCRILGKKFPRLSTPQLFEKSQPSLYRCKTALETAGLLERNGPNLRASDTLLLAFSERQSDDVDEIVGRLRLQYLLVSARMQDAAPLFQPRLILPEAALVSCRFLKKSPGLNDFISSLLHMQTDALPLRPRATFRYTGINQSTGYRYVDTLLKSGLMSADNKNLSLSQRLYDLLAAYQSDYVPELPRRQSGSAPDRSQLSTSWQGEKIFAIGEATSRDT